LLPYDWGWFAFVGGDKTKVKDVPKSLRAELARSSDLKVVIQDPRSSTPGLGLRPLGQGRLWRERAREIWTDLADNILTVTPGWSEAYALFTGGEADAVLSYSTSPAYHVLAEGDETKVAWSFADGHLAQVEVAALVAASDQPDLGKAFLAYLTGPEAQAVIPETNWMFPVLMPEGGLPAAFSLGGPFEPLILSPFDAAAMRDQAVEDWRGALAQ
jgi:thiamine transport system substrate-binding protein